MYETIIWKIPHPYIHFIKKIIYAGTIRIMKIMQKIRFNCQLFLSTTILERVVEALSLTIMVEFRDENMS